MPLRWDSRQGRLITEAEWRQQIERAAQRTAEERAKWEEDERRSDPNYRVEQRIKEEGVVLAGQISFKGPLAHRVIRWMEEHGYKDFRYDGALLKILPEDKAYGDWVKEALYWYARQCGMLEEENISVSGTGKVV